jgi:hypothetical protein
MMNLGLEDVVESHSFERNKYKHQAPQLEYKDPDLAGQILGINELLYDWEHGHAPQPVFWAEFDGTGDYIEISDHDDFSFGDAFSDSPFSLAAVIRVVDPASFDGAIISKYNGNIASEYVFFSNNGQLQFNVYDLVSTSRLKTISDAVVLEDGQVHQVVATYDGSGNSSGLKVYLDGELLTQTTSTAGAYTAMHNTSTALQLGSSVFGVLDFSRNIQHAMIFNSELTADDITQLNGLYSKGILGVDSVAFDKYSDIVSWWKLDENDRKSSTANDSVGTHDGTFNGDAHISTEYLLFGKEAENCLWWHDRAERDEILSVSTNADPDREDLRERRNTVVSGSTYVLRKLARPYKFSADRQRLLEVGSNRNANKNRSLHAAVINGGEQIQLNKADIYDFKQCNDILDPQAEKIYTAKTDTTGTEGYLDADADMILPFTLYSSSVGTDFSEFKDNLSITNNHDDQYFSFQGPFVREHAGGMPHRRVKFGTAAADRPEAYALSASSTTLTLKPATGPKSLTSRGMGLQTVYNIANIKTNTETTPPVLGNYSKDYEIVLTNGRSINNSYLVESGSIVIAPVAPGYVFGAVDFTSPVRGRAEHIIANQFSAPGGPETQGVYGRDKESGEYSIYNTVNYRNLSVREPLNILSTERSEQFGYRSGSTTQGSIHMTNRNYFHSTGALGEVSKPDNQFVQHPIPQNDFGYSWITASATNSKFEFVEANDGFGHQHMFGTASAQAIQFLSASIVGSQHWVSTYLLGVFTGETITVLPPTFRGKHGFGGERDQDLGGAETYGGFVPVDFVGLNTTILDPRDADQNILGFPSLEIDLEIFNPAYGGNISADANYVNSDFNEIIQVVGAPYDRLGNTINYGVTILNSIILNRQGPYGWPSWKQLRGADHPIVRAHKKSNTFSRVFLGDPTVGTGSIIQSRKTPSMNRGAALAPALLGAYERSNHLIAIGDTSQSKSRLVKNYTDIIATNRFRGARYITHPQSAAVGSPTFVPSGLGDLIRDPRHPSYFTSASVAPNYSDPGALSQRVRESNWAYDRYYYDSLSISPLAFPSTIAKFETYQNNLTSFANMQIAEDTEYRENLDSQYLSTLDDYLTINRERRNRLVEINYIEKIYPREVNTFTKNARERIHFDYFPWKSLRASRNLLLSGNVNHEPASTLLNLPTLKAFSKYTSTDKDDYKTSLYGKYDVLDMSIATTSSLDLQIGSHISSSTWLLDSRKDFSTLPVDIRTSYFNFGKEFLTSSEGKQATRAEGILQNDFSTFPLGYNGLYGTPPFSTVYNRRIPQEYSTSSFLSGEAKWEAADTDRGPFYDSYKEYAEEIRLVGQDHSIVPEFRISEFTEQIISEEREYPKIGDDYLTLTGAVHPKSSGDINIGGAFFRTYANSDFLKYFSLYDEQIVGTEGDKIHDVAHARINFKCKAAMKFLPYKGFYPAERATELTNLFQKCYLDPDTINLAGVANPPDGITEEDSRRYAALRANASRYKASKPLFGPGILFNSIKAGTAVDYPIFYEDLTDVYASMSATDAIQDFTTLSIPTSSMYTGSIINSTEDAGIPRIKSYTTKRIQFEDMTSPVELFREDIHSNEPHPSASLIYGTDHWHRIIERPSKFGDFVTEDARARLGHMFRNTKEDFSRQMAPYTMAMQNFTAETVNFFVEDGHLTTAMSKPIKERFVSGTIYKMRARLTNVGTTMYDRHSAFGPPVDDGGDGVDLTVYTTGSIGTAANMELTFNDHSGSGGGTLRYDIRNQTATASLPEFSFRDENFKQMDVYLYDSTVFTPASDGSEQFLGSNVTLYPDTPTNGSTAFIDVKGTSGLGSAVAEGIARALTSSFSDVDFEVNRSSNVLEITSSVIGAQTSNLNFSQSAQFQDDVDGWVDNGTNIYAETSPAFLGGIDAASSTWTTSTTNSKTEHGFMPYVPPFLDPNADPYVEITFTPSETREYGAKEIIEDCTFEYFNFDEVPSNAATNTNYQYAMALSASLNLGLCVSLRTDNIEEVASTSQPGKSISKLAKDQDQKISRWVIQTKWETPVLNFAHVSASALDLDTNSVTTVSGSPWKDRYWDSYYERGLPRTGVTPGDFLTASVGMWHQKGEVLQNSSPKGYFLEIEDIPVGKNVPGLAGKLGFNLPAPKSTTGLPLAKPYRRRIGPVESRKLVKEAIVAIPYVLREDQDNRVEFVKFHKEFYSQALENVRKLRKEAQSRPISDEIVSIAQYRKFLEDVDRREKTIRSDSPINAIEYQLFMMDEYILPPELDFLKNDLSLTPFMMYFFQFHASFNQEDLSNIWQNLYPSSATSTANPRYSYANERILSSLRAHNDVSYVSHYLETADLSGTSLCPADDPRALFSPEDKNNNTRWLVFKVKQRGKSNLEEVRKQSIDPRAGNIEKMEYVRGGKASFDEATLPTGLPGAPASESPALQFNWPYDYFSFVELIKLETKIDSYNYVESE